MKNKQIIIFIVLSSIFLSANFSLVYSQEKKGNGYVTDDKKQSEPAENNIKKNAIKSPARFVPSEKINADSSVSFPVDI